MSAIDNSATAAGENTEAQPGVGAISNFQFLPTDLVAKCRALIESYHEMNGYGRLPDMLWHSDARDIIASDLELAQLFKNASKSRGAKRANDSFLLLATVAVSLEALARDFAGWGRRFPAAKRQAESLLGGLPLRQRVWLMDMYLYPSLGIHRELASALVPSSAET
jgi:hypothetical protein